MTIQLLSEKVSSKIAAGEVIERPASVIKELVENSLDAGSSEIYIEIKEGGVDYIRVVDNGCGIPADDVELAFQRFATSKISDTTDLESIGTLGFRGEALPSIGSVSQINLVTKVGQEDSGISVDICYGEVLRKVPQGAPIGTSITVRHLFKNFPARRKFLRTTATETSRIQTLVTSYSLAYPEIRFRLDVAGATVFTSSGSGDLRETISNVYGLAIAQSMLELRQNLGPCDNINLFASGMISPPSVNRANRTYITLFVNRRLVQSRMLTYALEQAYHGFLMERRHPLAIVNITMPYEEVDINVHPSKREVRFRRDNQVFGVVQQSVRHTLTKDSPVPDLSRVQAGKHGEQFTQDTRFSFWPSKPFALNIQSATESSLSPDAHPLPGPIDMDSSTARETLPVLRVLGQIHNTYIVTEGPKGMYLIDQHAAHERVLFEKVRSDSLSQTPRKQTLLEPLTIELNQVQKEVMDCQVETISGLGFVVEPFGDGTYLLRGVPSLMKGEQPGQAFLEVLDLISDGGGYESWDERGAYSIACHSAIRAGKRLSQEEMSELTRQLEQCILPNTCPHGRPTMIHISVFQLEKEFGRK